MHTFLALAVAVMRFAVTHPFNTVSSTVVTCPPPQNIERGYMSNNEKRKFDYKETVKYGCHGDFVVEGSQQIVCQKYGNWSEKPSCKGTAGSARHNTHVCGYLCVCVCVCFTGPCSVGINRGRILYKGQKLWIKEFTPNKVLHNELVSVYCLDKGRKCGYAVSTQCIDGKLRIPECFEGRKIHSTKSKKVHKTLTSVTFSLFQNRASMLTPSIPVRFHQKSLSAETTADDL